MEPGDTVLIHGASGGVGSAAVQMAKRQGSLVIGTAGLDLARKLIAREGADHVLDHNDPNHLNQVTEITAGDGADVILEMRPDLNLELDLSILAREGRLVLIGGYDETEFQHCRWQRTDAISNRSGLLIRPFRTLRRCKSYYMNWPNAANSVHCWPRRSP